MNIKRVIGGMAILALVLITVPALANFDGDGWFGRMMGGGYGYHMGPGHGPGHMRGYGYGRGLDENQAREINEARQKFIEETTELRQEVSLKERELEALYANPESTKDDLLAKQKELDELRNELESKEVKFQARFRGKYPNTSRGYGYGPGSCWD